MKENNVNELDPERQSRKPATLGLVGMVASAVLGATLMYNTVTGNYERKINHLQHDEVFERAELYLSEWRRRAYESNDINHNELAQQYGIPLTESGEIDYTALQRAMFPERQDKHAPK